MIKLIGFTPPIKSAYSGKYQPFRWQYEDAAGKILSRKEAKRRKRGGEQVIGLYNPMKFVQHHIPKQEISQELPQVSDD